MIVESEDQKSARQSLRDCYIAIYSNKETGCNQKKHRCDPLARFKSLNSAIRRWNREFGQSLPEVKDRKDMWLFILPVIENDIKQKLGKSKLGPIPDPDIAKRTSNLGFSFQLAYASYLKSPQWRQMRANVLNLVGSACEICGDKSNSFRHIHHLHYGSFTNESIDDLQVLCEVCHSREHLRRDRSTFRNLNTLHSYISTLSPEEASSRFKRFVASQ